MKNYRYQLFGLMASLIILAAGGLSCRRDAAQTPVTPDRAFDATDTGNFIIGSADAVSWGGQYGKNNTYFMVNIPIVGAVKVEYAVKGGGSFALFLETATPTKMEIGLKTVNGVTDELESVCVTYLEGGVFAAKPANIERSIQHKATHYLRKLDDGSAENWWPVEAAFTFDSEPQTICVVTNGVAQGVDVAGPFPKTTPLTPCGSGGVRVGGYCWYMGAEWQSCDTVCENKGLACNLTGRHGAVRGRLIVIMC